MSNLGTIAGDQEEMSRVFFEHLESRSSLCYACLILVQLRKFLDVRALSPFLY